MRRAVAKKTDINSGNTLYNYIERNEIGRTLDDGWEIVFDDTDEPVPIEDIEKYIPPFYISDEQEV